jgi:(1->4)-alpha-D-glucan 1-alpha-D-glucosylmutase
MTDLRATYRIQLSPGFAFDDAAGLADYVGGIGVSHVHLSPVLEARRGSPHGYDVVDPTRVRAELGGEEGLARLASALHERGLGVILDFVPNHMAAWHENLWWWDVLARGTESPYAHYFDIDWSPPQQDLVGKVLLPVLSEPLPDVIERGEIRIETSKAGAVVMYGDRRFPVAKGTLPGTPGGGRAPGELASILSRQHYVLGDWQRGPSELNYRRFTNVSALVAMRVDQDDVFDAVHAKALDLIESGVVDGLRIDHLDGLRDPVGYLHRLRERIPGAPIFVEKILTRDERPRTSWPINGTTGYDFLKQAGALFVDERSEEHLSSVYADFTGARIEYAALEAEKKRLMLDVLFPTELNRVARLVFELAEAHDGPGEAALEAAIRELVASFPVYRTYVRADAGTADVEDAARIDEGIALAGQRRPDVSPEAWVFLRDLLLLRYRGEREADLTARFQQLTGAVMAKGVEDTAFYCYNRLTSLNEVGGDPCRYGVTPDAFHAWCAETVRLWPGQLSVLSTHDTKRSADVRLRISLLSEIPDEWSSAVRRWADLNKDHKTAGMPGSDDEYLIYQTLLGTWPIELERLRLFARKAVREAKRRTAWTTSNEEYDRAVDDFVEGVLSHEAFIADLSEFIAPLIGPWRTSSLSQTLVHMTAPGVPQIYGGDEMWFLRLVDPDNRRPVDFDVRRDALARLGRPDVEVPPAETGPARVSEDELGMLKLRVIRAALDVRRKRPEAFAVGSDYEPLLAYGPKFRHVVAFARGRSVVTVVPRLLLGLGGDWGETELELPPGAFTDVFTGSTHEGTIRLDRLLASFPVALLLSRREDP